ncbi:MAG: hypothetical protein V3V32_04455 [Dehalococcoidia bacterium]
MKLELADLVNLRALQKISQTAAIEAQRQQLIAQGANLLLREATWDIEEKYGLVGQNPQLNLFTGEIQIPEVAEEA